MSVTILANTTGLPPLDAGATEAVAYPPTRRTRTFGSPSSPTRRSMSPGPSGRIHAITAPPDGSRSFIGSKTTSFSSMPTPYEWNAKLLMPRIDLSPP